MGEVVPSISIKSFFKGLIDLKSVKQTIAIKIDLSAAGDITTLDVDCIVNAANENLMPGGGVCGAIHQAAGQELALECKRIGHCGVGEARITKGYHLKAEHVIHTVGPVWHGGERMVRINIYLTAIKNHYCWLLITALKPLPFRM